MGTYYSIYAEVRVGNKWFNISPLMRNEDGNVRVQPIISGKSMLHETVEELREDSFMCGRPSDMSDELLSIYNHADDEIVEFYPKGTNYKQYYNQILFAVNYGKSVKNRVNDNQPTRYRGYVSRYSLAAFEIGEIDHFNHWLTQKEYDKLTKDEKQEYTYYEWNDWCDWYGIYAQICKKVDCLLGIFNDWAIYHLKSANLDECTPTADYVRLIVSTE